MVGSVPLVIGVTGISEEMPVSTFRGDFHDSSQEVTFLEKYTCGPKKPMGKWRF